MRGGAAHKTSLPPFPAERSQDHHIGLTQQLSKASSVDSELSCQQIHLPRVELFQWIALFSF